MRQSFNQARVQTGPFVDEGLRAYLQRVYMYMALGLVITGAVAYYVAATPAIAIPLWNSPLRWLFTLAVVLIPLGLGVGLNRLSRSAAQGLFWAYSALMGLALFPVFVMYQELSILRIALVTASTFGAMSIYGYTTRKDLTSWGSFLFMGVIGVVLASLVNLFLRSSGLEFALSIMTVIVFTGLTAYDTQRIKHMYHAAQSEEQRGKLAVFGALMLYLDFINIFLALMRLFGDRR